MMIAKDAALAPKGLVPRHLGAPCATLIFCDVSGSQATSPNTMAKLTQVFGWRITTTDLIWWGGGDLLPQLEPSSQGRFPRSSL
jgi:hypothetical protein